MIALRLDSVRINRHNYLPFVLVSILVSVSSTVYIKLNHT